MRFSQTPTPNELLRRASWTIFSFSFPYRPIRFLLSTVDPWANASRSWNVGRSPRPSLVWVVKCRRKPAQPMQMIPSSSWCTEFRRLNCSNVCRPSLCSLGWTRIACRSKTFGILRMILVGVVGIGSSNSPWTDYFALSARSCGRRFSERKTESSFSIGTQNMSAFRIWPLILYRLRCLHKRNTVIPTILSQTTNRYYLSATSSTDRSKSECCRCPFRREAHPSSAATRWIWLCPWMSRTCTERTFSKDWKMFHLCCPSFSGARNTRV